MSAVCCPVLSDGMIWKSWSSSLTYYCQDGKKQEWSHNFHNDTGYCAVSIQKLVPNKTRLLSCKNSPSSAIQAKKQTGSFLYLADPAFISLRFKRLKWDFYSMHRIRTHLNYQWLQCCQCSWQSCICDLCLKMVTWVQCSFSVIQHLCSEEWGNFWFSVWGLTFPHVAGAL